MADWITVLILIGFGIILLVLEIIVVPGTTVVGAIGALLVVVGVVLTFKYYGTTIGWSTAAGSALVTAVVLYYSFTTNAWSRFASKKSIDSKVNEGQLDSLTIGAKGVALSALRPFGKGELNGRIYEVKTFGDYLETGKRIRVIEILSNQVVVEQIN
jgi:membrane-bound ClpP family serine protease